MDDLQGSSATVTTMPQLANLLRDLRRRQSRSTGRPPLTYRQLAARTGWSHGIIGEYLAGRVLPPTDRFDDLVRLLGATPAEQVALASARDRVEEQRAAAEHPDQRPRDWSGVAPRQLPADLTTFAGRTWQLALLDRLTAERRPIVPDSTIGRRSAVSRSSRASCQVRPANVVRSAGSCRGATPDQSRGR